MGNLGAALLWSGEVEEAVTRLEEGLAEAQGTRLEVSRINTLAHLALAEATSGRLTSSLAHAKEAVDLVEARGWAPLSQAATAYLALSIAHFRRNEVEAARALLVQAETTALREPVARWATALTGARQDASTGRLTQARDRLARLQDELDGQVLPPFLRTWLELATTEIELAGGPRRGDVRVTGPADEPDHDPTVLVGVARTLLAGNALREAVEVLEPLRTHDAGTADGVDAWLLTALAADRLREDNRAATAISRAVELARAEEIRRPFVEHHPEQVTRLLTLVSRLESGSDPYVDGLLQELHGTGPEEGPVLTEELTERELIVLRFLPTMMTNAEIADELFVSVNTVKAHLKRIFRKLGVTSRRDAVHRARELGVLSSSSV